MSTVSPPNLTASGVTLDLSPEAFGRLRESNDVIDDFGRLRERMRADGYLFLRGVMDHDRIIEARRYITDRLSEDGFLDPDRPAIESVARAGADVTFRPDLALDNTALHEALYSGPLMDFFAGFLGDEVLHYGFTWLRATAPGKSAAPHCDIVYMGRGTFDVFTVWTPLGDIAIDGGALMVLEESHLKKHMIGDYLQRDVDTYCANGPNATKIESGELLWEWDGILDYDPCALQRRLGGRWLSSDYRIGDVLIFTMGTVHASLDNLSNRIRLSSDSRYQSAAQPADERWIGPDPVGHTLAGKRGRIC